MQCNERNYYNIAIEIIEIKGLVSIISIVLSFYASFYIL